MRRAVLWAAAALVVVISLAACNTLTPDQQSAIGTVLGDMYRDGKLTGDQYQALLQALQTGRVDQLISIATEVGAAIVLSLLGVRAWRGPITARRGVAPGAEIVAPSAPAPTGVANG